MQHAPTDEADAEFVALLTSHQQALRLYVASLLPGSPEAADVAQQGDVESERLLVGSQQGDEFGVSFICWDVVHRWLQGNALVHRMLTALDDFF